MKRTGSADLPLHYGYVPQWLYERMAALGLAITESILQEYGSAAFLQRMANPFWFQSFGAVMGMDWHSSGITTSVLGALKRAINPHSKTLGIYVCGGKGKYSTQTPTELLQLGDSMGVNGQELARCSRLSAKVDNTAIQDGYQLYTHNFLVNNQGAWTVVQQGMHATNKTARRYHWCSEGLESFTEEPHTGICGVNQGYILNLTAKEAAPAKTGMMALTKTAPNQWLSDFQRLVMPAHHEVISEDVNIKRLGSVIWLAHHQQPQNFEELLMMEGVGPRTLQSLALVSEVIHGSPSRFSDPARFSFAHGGKDGHPFPVPIKTYDETISFLQTAVHKAKLGLGDKSRALKQLHLIAARAENDFVPVNNVEAVIQKERDDSWKYGGCTVIGKAKKPKGSQLELF